MLLLASTLVFAQPPWQPFTATSLTGKQVSSESLIGQPVLLIVTPSREAAEPTRAWAKALRGHFDRDAVKICDVLAIDLPFFISTDDALSKAREKIPEQYHDETWLTQATSLEESLDIDTGDDMAHVLVLDSQGNIVERVTGAVTEQRRTAITDAIGRITS